MWFPSTEQPSEVFRVTLLLNFASGRPQTVSFCSPVNNDQAMSSGVTWVGLGGAFGRKETLQTPLKLQSKCRNHINVAEALAGVEYERQGLLHRMPRGAWQKS